MSFFCDVNLNIDTGKEMEKLIKYYIYYVKKHKGKISERFENNLRIKILEGHSTLAEANANVETNTIKIRKNSSIITLFHELTHISDQWRDFKDGKIYACWEYEKDFTAQMSWYDKNNKVVNVKRGIHGRFLGEAKAELYATKIFLEMCNYSRDAQIYASKRTYYDEEIIILKKICIILGINEDDFLNLPSENDFGRNFLRKKCEQLTGQSRLWDILEDNLDYIEMEKVISTSHPEYKISESSKKAFKTNRENIKNILDYILNALLNRNIISIIEYNNRIKQLRNLDKYNETSYFEKNRKLFK